MASIDLFDDFNEEQDAMAGDYDEGEGGDENRSNQGSDNDGNDDDQDKEKIAPKVKIVRTKRKIPTLNVERMKGPRGIIAMDEYFKNMKFKGKGYEKQDLDEVLLRMQHWAHR
jgi:TIMELESS-interacting protein